MSAREIITPSGVRELADDVVPERPLCFLRGELDQLRAACLVLGQNSRIRSTEVTPLTCRGNLGRAITALRMVFE